MSLPLLILLVLLLGGVVLTPPLLRPCFWKSLCVLGFKVDTSPIVTVNITMIKFSSYPKVRHWESFIEVNLQAISTASANKLRKIFLKYHRIANITNFAIQLEVMREYQKVNIIKGTGNIIGIYERSVTFSGENAVENIYYAKYVQLVKSNRIHALWFVVLDWTAQLFSTKTFLIMQIIKPQIFIWSKI